MKSLLILCLLLPICTFAQADKHSEEDVFFATLHLLNYVDVVSLKNGMKWYMEANDRKKQKKFNDSLYISGVVLYQPEFTDIHGKKYKDVAIFQDIIFNCTNKTYMIVGATYYHNYNKEFDKLHTTSGSFKPIPESSIFYSLLSFSCSKQ
jgi:hypothetical protein